jgi:hypothetical protein
MRGFLKIGRINPASDLRRRPVYGTNENPDKGERYSLISTISLFSDNRKHDEARQLHEESCPNTCIPGSVGASFLTPPFDI